MSHSPLRPQTQRRLSLAVMLICFAAQAFMLIQCAISAKHALMERPWSDGQAQALLSRWSFSVRQTERQLHDLLLNQRESEVQSIYYAVVSAHRHQEVLFAELRAGVLLGSLDAGLKALVRARDRNQSAELEVLRLVQRGDWSLAERLHHELVLPTHVSYSSELTAYQQARRDLSRASRARSEELQAQMHSDIVDLAWVSLVSMMCTALYLRLSPRRSAFARPSSESGKYAVQSSHPRSQPLSHANLLQLHSYLVELRQMLVDFDAGSGSTKGERMPIAINTNLPLPVDAPVDRIEPTTPSKQLVADENRSLSGRPVPPGLGNDIHGTAAEKTEPLS